MNNIETFYESKKLLEFVNAWSHNNHSFFFRVYYSEKENEVKIVLEKAFVEGLKEDEKRAVLEIINSMLNEDHKRLEMEDFLLKSLEKTVESNKEQVHRDLGIEIIDEEEGLSDPRD